MPRKKKNTSKYEKRYDVLKICVFVSVLTITIFVLLLGGFWVYEMIELIESVSRIMCYTKGTYHDIRFGHNEGQDKFTGTKGALYFIDHLSEEVKNLFGPQGKSTLDSIKKIDSRQIKTSLNNFRTACEAFTNYVGSKRVKSCMKGPLDQAETVQTKFIKEVVSNNPYIDSTLKHQYEVYANSATSLANFAKFIKELEPDKIHKKIEEDLSHLRSKVEDFDQKGERMHQFIKKTMDYESTTNTLSYALMLISMLKGSLLIFNLVFMFFTMYLKKCMLLNKICKLIMNLMIVTGILMSFIALLFIVLTILLNNLCFIWDDAIKSKQFANTIIPKNYRKYSNVCFFEQSGSFRDFMDQDRQEEFDSSMKKFDSLYYLDDSDRKDTIGAIKTSIDPKDIGVYETFLEKMQGYHDFYSEKFNPQPADKISTYYDVFDGNENNGFEENLNNLNERVAYWGDQKKGEGKIQDQYQIGVKTCQQIVRNDRAVLMYVASGNFNQGLTHKPSSAPPEKYNPYCLAFSILDFKDPDQRYPKSVAQSDLVNLFHGLYRCTKDYQKVMGEIIKEYNKTKENPNTVLYRLEQLNNVIRDVKTKNEDPSQGGKVASKSTLEKINESMNETLAFMRDIGGGVEKVFSCSIVRKEILLMRDAVCGYGNSQERMALIATYMMVIGPILVYLGICMCCQIRISNRDRNKMPNHMKKRNEITIEINELML